MSVHVTGMPTLASTRVGVSTISADALTQWGVVASVREAPVSAGWEPRGGFRHLATGSKGELTRSAPLAIRDQGGQIFAASATSRPRRILTPTSASNAATSPPQSNSCRSCKPNMSSSLAVIPSFSTSRISRDGAACFPMSTCGRGSHGCTWQALPPALTGRAGLRIVVTFALFNNARGASIERATRTRGRFGRG